MPNSINEYFNLRIEEANARLNAVTKIIQHSTTKGSVGERVLRDLVSSFVPTSYNVSSGFVVKNTEISKQVDILVFGHHQSVPLYFDEHFAVVTQDMPCLAIESKMQLNKSTFEQAVDNIISIKRLNKYIDGIIWAYRGIKFPALKNHMLNIEEGIEQMPDCIFNLEREYVIVKHKTDNADKKNWTVFKGRAQLAKILLQRVLFAAGIDNLTKYIAEIAVPSEETF